MSYVEALKAVPSRVPERRQGSGSPSSDPGGRALPVDRVTLSAAASKAVANPNDARTDGASRVDVFADGRALRPSDIGMCLAMGRIDDAVEVAARLSGVPTVAAIQAYRNGDVGKAVSQLASIGVDGATAGWLLRGMGRAVPLAPYEASKAPAASAAYLRVARASPDPSDHAEDAEEVPSVDFRI